MRFDGSGLEMLHKKAGVYIVGTKTFTPQAPFLP
jgi:hypothetical protein